MNKIETTLRRAAESGCPAQRRSWGGGRKQRGSTWPTRQWSRRSGRWSWRPRRGARSGVLHGLPWARRGDRGAGRADPAARARGARRLDPVRRELDEYFAGRRTEFETLIDWSQLAGFTRKVLRATARIGFGETSTYAGVAYAREARAQCEPPATRSGRTPCP